MFFRGYGGARVRGYEKCILRRKETLRVFSYPRTLAPRTLEMSFLQLGKHLTKLIAKARNQDDNHHSAETEGILGDLQTIGNQYVETLLPEAIF